MEHITSFQNPIVKHIRKLGRMKKMRDLHSETVLEGYRLVKDGLSSGIHFKYVLMDCEFIKRDDGKDIYDSISAQSSHYYTTTEKIIKGISLEKNPQGVIAVCSYPKVEFSTVINSKPTFILILDEVQDPGNAGTLIRTAAATNVDAVVLIEGSVDVYNPKVLRASMGAVFRIPVIPSVPAHTVIKQIKLNRMNIVSADNNGSITHYQANFRDKAALVIGNEGRGVGDAMSGAANTQIKIPMERGVESLNAAIAGGIIMYEAYRQRTVGDL